MCQTVSIVSGNGLLPFQFQHQAISSVPEACWLKINWTPRNNPVKFISPCYLIHLFITVHKIWIELNWNWKKMNWIGIELKDSESDLNLNWIELKNPESNLNWNWIELKEMNWSEPCVCLSGSIPCKKVETGFHLDWGMGGFPQFFSIVGADPPQIYQIANIICVKSPNNDLTHHLC